MSFSVEFYNQMKQISATAHAQDKQFREDCVQALTNKIKTLIEQAAKQGKLVVQIDLRTIYNEYIKEYPSYHDNTEMLYFVRVRINDILQKSPFKITYADRPSQVVTIDWSE